jgi:hypothetical protein
MLTSAFLVLRLTPPGHTEHSVNPRVRFDVRSSVLHSGDTGTSSLLRMTVAVDY